MSTTVKQPTADDLKKILRLHADWRYGRPEGLRANLRGADLDGANLRDANLRGANLDGADLRDANLRGADLRDANLRDANLRGADLDGANLRDANLRGADLRVADLRDANLRDANLRDADLRGANLDDANLRDANLRDANLRGADLDGANLGDNTVLPDGVVWKTYIDELVPGLLQAGGRPLDELAQPRVFTCHSWENCPMAEAFGVHSTSEIPPLYRAHANLFIQLFDARVAPLNDLPELRRRWKLAPLPDGSDASCEVPANV